MLAELREVLGKDRARAEPLELALYARDAGVASGHAAAVCFPRDARQLADAVRITARHDRPFVARGSGTGLAGGATPMGDPLVIVTTQLNHILDVDAEQRVAWVEPGVLNLDLSRAVAHLGLHYAPDPSSQQACTIGGNVATNAGGPHCLASGVTATHVLAVEVVLADGSTTMLGGLEPDQPGFDLRGCFVGSEGTMGIASRIAVRLTPNPPAVRTLLLDFTAIEDAGAAVSGIIAAGIVPAALEMMDAQITRAVEDYVGAGYPRDAAAVLLVELDGLQDGVDVQVAVVERVGLANGARSVRVAADEAERALLWKGRKSAFGAIARIAPDYYLHDAVVPRTKLVEVLRQVYAIAAEHQLTMMNVFHAGDGNLHPLIVFDSREPGIWERVHRAGDQILAACVAAGGVLSGEHGIGLEKREAMPLVFSVDDLDAQARLRDAFDPSGRANPSKILPKGSRCGELQRVPEGAVDLTAIDDATEELRARVRDADAVTAVGARTQWEVGGALEPGAVEVHAPSGVVVYDPADLTVTVGAGTPVRELAAVLGDASPQECALDPRSDDATVGGVLAVGLSGHRRLRYGPLRDRVLEVRFVTADGRLVKGGGPTVKNVSGFDIPRLLVGSFGTIGVLVQVILRCQPVPEVAEWGETDADPFDVRRRTFRPSCIAWDGNRTRLLVEGVAADVEHERRAAGAEPADGPPTRPDGPHRGRISIGLAGIRELAPSLADTGVRWLAEIGVGSVHVAADTEASLLAARATAEQHGGWLLREKGAAGLDGFGRPLPNLAIMQRIRAAFDPEGKLNAGRLPLGSQGPVDVDGQVDGETAYV